MTPEAKVKRILRQGLACPKIYRYSVVETGFGDSSLDMLLCVEGQFVAIEAKRKGGEPTPRQRATANVIRRAGGVVFLVAGEDRAKLFVQVFQDLRRGNATLTTRKTLESFLLRP